MDQLLATTDDGVDLHVAGCGQGPDVVVLSGGPGCVHYLADAALAPDGCRSWFPDPRGVGRSGGGPHDMARAIEDLEVVRRSIGAESWIVLGHSWGSDLAVRYALEHPHRVAGVVGIAGHGLHRDREWSAAYEAGAAAETPIEIDHVPDIHASLMDSFKVWIHQPRLWRELADSPVPMRFIAAGRDIRPRWPLQQLAELVPQATFDTVPDVVHDFWATDPGLWRATCSAACVDLAQRWSGTINASGS
ncbi:alpha/beta fold hydrolase [Nocardioides marmotae]|uniref:alpha/beta fold hydrolase n=1 Tax=Nocardioides marmotae TaxID=2663857 RepID=UPI0012B55463|nr:alpha/beta hydrolase [Nocardioides marmotae]MBC9732622.1 alpha/beta fold hydrolase [Nocardioides marmotae]MTB83740.1 alpha/beta fold hydrolase [Nocardioides marmotae]